ncbi:60S ribosomal export protein NMD3 isoform X1 [Musca domestica]|uniref:60S ribosomal export protein NMD3 n=2 Tax=Musca domestica TaxID=7370 RepID=A0A9J7CIG0_MUSDO|nr:60S ribosomal export protein NMD3 isoform X1 [Musca domestica]
MEYVDFNAKGSPNKNASGETVQIKRNTILCCECGVRIESNSHNMCLSCLRDHLDITANISKQVELQFCRNCERYLQPPGEWINARWESRELLGLCLKKVRGLKDLHLIDACFIWTEKHSRRIKVKLVVEGNEADHSSLRQGAIVEYTIQNQMCHECHRVEAKDYWRCVVQVRQHAENKKTYLYLEQLILKHKAHENTLGIKPMHGGLDFYFATENHARKLVNFLESMVPVKVTSSRRLISHDKNSNIHHYKYTWSVEIAPLSKDSLVCLSPKFRHILGNIPPLCLVHRVTHGMHLIDPVSGQISELNGLNYFRSPFEAICNPRQLVEYIVMDIEPVQQGSHKPSSATKGQIHMSERHLLCDVWLVRASQLGTNDNTIHARSHLGHILNVGDSVMGYSMTEANINEQEFEKLKSHQIPDIILVRKLHDRQAGNKKRSWKLKHLTYGAVDESLVKDKLDFIEDLEEDAELRKNINVYGDKTKPQTEMGEEDNSTDVDLAERLDESASLGSTINENETEDKR